MVANLVLSRERLGFQQTDMGKDLGLHQFHRAQDLAMIQAVQTGPTEEVGETIMRLGFDNLLDDAIRTGSANSCRACATESAT